MEKRTTKYRATACIEQRFAQLLLTDREGATEAQVENFAHNCALALDFIGAGKIAKDNARELLVRCLNDEYKDEAELITYIDNIRAPRKSRELKPETKAMRDAVKLLKLNRYSCDKIASFVGLDEATVVELARKLNKE